VEAIEETSIKLDLGCGEFKKKDYFGVDILQIPEVDLVFDLFTFPWPWADGSIEEINCAYLYQLVPANLRVKFVQEAYRILKPGGKLFIIVAHDSSYRSIVDPRTQWPPIVEQSFAIFEKEWRARNKYDDKSVTCDFTPVIGYTMTDPNWVTKHDDAKGFAVKHYRNVVDDLHATLIKK
jgi:SAM-dependent methyltransferase